MANVFPYYVVAIYPNWQRGPGDAGTYHHAIGAFDDRFRSLPAAKKAAEKYLKTEPEHRVEIYRMARGGTKTRSMYGSTTGMGRVKWTRAR